MTNETLAAIERELAALNYDRRRPSIPQQMLLRAVLLQAFCSTRSRGQLMELVESSKDAIALTETSFVLGSDNDLTLKP